MISGEDNPCLLHFIFRAMKICLLQLLQYIEIEEQIDKEAKDFDKEKQASEPISAKDLPTSSIF